MTKDLATLQATKMVGFTKRLWGWEEVEVDEEGGTRMEISELARPLKSQSQWTGLPEGYQLSNNCGMLLLLLYVRKAVVDNGSMNFGGEEKEVQLRKKNISVECESIFTCKRNGQHSLRIGLMNSGSSGQVRTTLLGARCR